MFYGYPIAATAENWLHECMCEMLSAIHASVDAGQPVPNWPVLIPAAKRSQLKSRRGLRDKLITYTNTYKKLSKPKRQQVVRSLLQQNQIAELLSCASDCECIDQLPKAIREPVTDLFTTAFKLLSEIGVRDIHYQAIYNANNYHVCPFCGCEYFDAPGAPREDLDHYLPRHLYPFAAANLRNLAPMGSRCNQRYKNKKDILKNDAGIRRHSFDPYEEERVIKVNLIASVPFAGADGQAPEWDIRFDPHFPACHTWDEIFSIRERIERDVLDPNFRRWLDDFASWFRKRINNPHPDATTLLDAIQTYSEDMTMLGFNAREFLRGPVFEMLHHHCAEGDGRLTDFMVTLVTIH